jgi:glucose-1-phosphate thymidylyltransferase
LIPVANKPILFYGIEAIIRAGITDIGIVVGDTKEEVMAAAGDGSQFGCKITYIHQDQPLGLAHAVLVSEDFLKKSRFIMYLGDNIIQHGISALVKEFDANKPNAQILLAHVPNPSEFGVAELKGKRIHRLEEKPKKPRSDLALVGAYMFDNTIFTAAKSIKPSGRGELEITDAISWLIDNGYTVDPHIIKGWWKDTGKLEDLLWANRMMLDEIETDIRGKVDGESVVEGKVIIEKGAVIEKTTIRGPAIIGAGAKICSSYIGPFTSIGPMATILHCEIEHSILLDECEIIDVGARVIDSLVGRRARVSRPDQKPHAYRFMLGDQSEVGIL